MASRSNEEFKLQLLRKLAEKARQLIARPQHLPSKTLRESLFVRKAPGKDQMLVGVPYFWAYYYHEGRGPVQPVEKKWLVWFRNPTHDPRLSFGQLNYPKRKADRKRLTKAEFLHGLRMNEAFKTEGDQMPYMVIAKHSGPAKGTPFFETGLRYYRDAARRIIAKEFPEFLKDKLFRELELKKSKAFRVRIHF